MNRKFYFLSVFFLVVASCKNDKKTMNNSDTEVIEESNIMLPNILTDEEKSEGWSLLFDGETTEGWHLYNDVDAKPIWAAIDGILTCDPLNGNGEHGDLVSDQSYENYDFTFEWKMTESGNSGVFVNVHENEEFEEAWFTGPEYQLLDASNKDFSIEEKRSGCLYGYAPQLTPTPTKAVGEWNTARIIQENGKIEFYLNGNLTAKADFNSQEWKDYVANSGFKNFPHFGASTKGHITLQEWTSPVWFRNLKIKEL
ncbi:DUF1080 domain-containing protein [Euzebyella marina]|uniref:DUF1080 domain-containing protein n=2 Tax=Euzebyella marina TaxID=1761453 RepID=A0A3G2L555_9FLAO|nr:DUF1080 domain-containing protein [Euzebyella marina]